MWLQELLRCIPNVVWCLDRIQSLRQSEESWCQFELGGRGVTGGGNRRARIDLIRVLWDW